jgi:hypothetical protein
MLRLKPSILAIELDFMVTLSTARNVEEVQSRMRDYRVSLARHGVEQRAMTWGLRLRTSRVIALAKEVWASRSSR